MRIKREQVRSEAKKKFGNGIKIIFRLTFFPYVNTDIPAEVVKRQRSPSLKNVWSFGQLYKNFQQLVVMDLFLLFFFSYKMHYSFIQHIFIF